jgi:putative ABC transport system permease protein
LIQDLRYGVRAMIAAPGFTLVALLALSLGIGANTAIFGIVNAVMLRPLPYREPGRVVMLWSHWINWNKTWVSQPEVADYSRQARSLEHVAAFQYTSFNLTGFNLAGSDRTSIAEPQRLRAAQVQAHLFAALGVQPIVGRTFTVDEDQPGHDHVVLLNEGLWRDHFGGDPSIVGRAISLDGTPYVVLGIIPSTLRLPIDYANRASTDLWVPLALGPIDERERGSHGLFVLGRLRQGSALRQAQAEMDAITRGFQQEYPGQYDREFGLTLVPAPDEVLGGIQPALVILLCAVAAVLMIACANVANLLLARAEVRQKEIAIRTVLGAGRFRIVRQLITEAVLLSGIGAAAGVALAYGLIRFLVALNPLKIPRVQDVAIDGRVLLFTAVTALATGVLFGLAPALQAARADAQPALKEGGRDSRAGAGWLRQALVVAEIAASVVLVAAAMLLGRSFAKLLTVDPGLNPTHVLTMRTSLPNETYPTPSSMVAAYREIARGLRELPGVDAAGAVTGLPLASTRGDWGIRLEGRPITGNIKTNADWQVVTPGYFAAIGTPLQAGRAFTDADQADTLPVIVINESMARRFWPGENPLGRRLTMGNNDRWITVVGVVANVRHRGLDQEARPEMYRPHSQFRFGGPEASAVPSMTWVLRTQGNPIAATTYARSAIHRVDPGLGVSDVQTMEQVLADSTSDRRLNTVLFTLLGGLALALATIGVYGVVAYSVTQRTHEIGLRMAIGARPADVERMILLQGCRLGLMGVAAGSALAVAGSRLIRGLLFQVSASDPITFVSVACALLAVAALASYLPARRATRVDPMVALRTC